LNKNFTFHFSDNFKQTIAIPFLDNLSQELNARFSKENRNITSIMNLVPSVVAFLSDETLDSLVNQFSFWKKDLPNSDGLKVELIFYYIFYLK